MSQTIAQFHLRYGHRGDGEKRQSLSKEEFLGLLIEDEWLYRENRKLTARLKIAKFKAHAAAVENIDYRTPRGLRKTQLLELAQNRWIAAHQSVRITGPSGAGKSYLAQTRGQNACRSGYSVQYVRLPTLLALSVQVRAQGTYDRLLKRLSKLALLVIDDLGLAVINEIEKQDLLEALEERYDIRRDPLEILDDRHNRRSTLITSQLPIEQWRDYIILDRLVHSAYKPPLKGESMRKANANLTLTGLSE